ncbi:MAG: CBS protein [uncultured bacterium]|nr:MAG: CBS protein [uncultured bacterium]
MTAKDIMTKNIITATGDMSIYQAAQLLNTYHLTGLPVVKDNKLMGIITESDFILKRLDIHLPSFLKLLNSIPFDDINQNKLSEDYKHLLEIKVADIMTKEVITISPDTPIEKIAHILTSQKVNPLPVVDNDSKLVGIISKADLVKLLTTIPS